MRILFCSDALTIDGVTSYILNVGAALKRSGHDIAVLGRWAGKGFQSRYKHEGFRVITCPSFSVGNFYFDVRAKLFRPDVIMTDPRRSFPLATRIKKLTNAPVITYFLDPVEKTDRPGRDLASLEKFSNVFTAFEPDILRRIVRALKRKGILCLIDDFGSGVASIDFLRDLAPNFIKLERDYITHINDAGNLLIVRHLSELAAELGTKVCIKGVENSVIREAIKTFPVTNVQGNFYSEAIQLDEIREKYL